jgi:DNA-binding LacI/PurR family transcriptional regulator
VVAATIRDVAEYSGLSLGTISKFINGGPVKEKTRLKIEEAIKKLKFKPNNIAKGLRNARTFTVGVLLSKLHSSFDGTIVSALEEYLLPLGYSIIVSHCHENAEREIEKIKFLLKHMVDGIVLMPFSASGRQIEVLKESKTPFVLIDQIFRQYKTDGVVLDNAGAVAKPVETLLQMGHRDIAIITGNKALYTSKERLAGYTTAMNRHGVPIREEYVRNGDYTIDGGYAATLDLLKLKKPPTALLASNFDITIGAVMAIHFLHKEVPRDLSLIGFDRFPLTNVISPPLSIISQPMEEMGRNAGRLLFKRISGDYTGYPELIVHQPGIELTESVRPLVT